MANRARAAPKKPHELHGDCEIERDFGIIPKPPK
jgi:hypothetical protein